MRPIRRLLARSLLAPLLLLPLLSCGYPKPSPDAVAAALGRSGTFIEPKTVPIPRRIEAHTDGSFGGGTLDDRQIAKLDPVLAILHANKLVDIQDVYGPDGGQGGYIHILAVSPASSASPDLFTETDEPVIQSPWGPQIKKIPGWRVTLGRREIVKVGLIVDSSSPVAEKLSPGYVLANFEFHWIPTEVGKLFDQASLEFDDLSHDMQVATANAGDLDTRATYFARAWLTRDKNGQWRVTLFDCRKCSTLS
jgi:hypothetical protein